MSSIETMFATRVSRRFGIGPAFVGCAAAGALIGILTPLAAGPVFVATLMVFIPQLIGDGLQTIEWISHDAVVQTVTPDRVLGRLNATPDVLKSRRRAIRRARRRRHRGVFGVRATIALGWPGMVAAVGWLAFSPLPRLRTVMPAATATVGEV